MICIGRRYKEMDLFGVDGLEWSILLAEVEIQLRKEASRATGGVFHPNTWNFEDDLYL